MKERVGGGGGGALGRRLEAASARVGKEGGCTNQVPLMGALKWEGGCLCLLCK